MCRLLLSSTADYRHLYWKEWDVTAECFIENREHTVVEVIFAVKGTGSYAPIGSESRKNIGRWLYMAYSVPVSR